MMKKITLVLAAAGVLGCGASVFAESTSTETLQQEIDSLQAQLAVVESKVNNHKSTTSSSDSALTTLPDTNRTTQLITPSNVLVANYVGIDSSYDGSNLIVNNPGVNNDVALLKIRKSEIDAYQKAGQAYTGEPKLIFSGEVEGSAVYTTPYNSTPAGTDFNLTDAELDTFIEGNRWVSGFMTFTYNSGSNGQADEVNNSELQLGQGYIIIGDLTTSPLYASFGQMYVPFGRYSNYIVSSPSTKILGRIQTRAINLGYHSINSEVAPFAAVYGYQGSSELDGNSASNSDIESYGANLGVNFAKGDYSATLGTSYTSNIANSSGLQGNGSSGSGFSQSSTSEELSKRVPGLDVNGLASYKDYTLLGEYVEATTEFNKNDLSYNGNGAKPKALDVEAAYSFVLCHPSYVALDYGKTWEALSLGVPEQNYGIVYSTAVWRNTSLTVELMHNIGYSNSDTAKLDKKATSNNASQGQSYNTASLRFDLFF